MCCYHWQVRVDISSLGWDLVELEQAALLVVAEERENRREEATPEHGNETEKSRASGNVHTLSGSQKDTEKCTASKEVNVGACSEAKLTPEKTTETLSEFGELQSHPVACEQLGAMALTASNHSCKQIQNLSAKLENLLTLDLPVGLPTPCKPLIEEVPPLLPPPEQLDDSSAGSTCSTCSSSDSSSSDSDTSSSENCPNEGSAD